MLYNITVLASTVKGDGPHSSPVLVVRTDQDSKLSLSAEIFVQITFESFDLKGTIMI